MKMDEILKLIDDQAFLDKIYGFSYRRCSTSHEAEDLCSNIVLSVLTAVYRQDNVENFYALVWTIARRVYADFCEKQRRECQNLSLENSDLSLPSKENAIDDFIEETVAAENIGRIYSAIAFLSKAYRDVMVMYYIDELKVRDIADRLAISETTVKQRLFSARKTVRKEVTAMNDKQLSLKPIHLVYAGTGIPNGNDPFKKAERTFSQNLIYLCKDKPKSAKELSEELCVPMPYVEEELEIQCLGENGQYGMLRRLDNGKYTLNVILLDNSEYEAAKQICGKHLPEISSLLKQSIEEQREDILGFPYLSPQHDIRLLLWPIIHRMFWNLAGDINIILKNRCFSDIAQASRPYSLVSVAYKDGEHMSYDFFGCDGISSNAVSGYRQVRISNAYGKQLKKHFDCGHIFSHDAKLLMTLRAVGGLAADSLSEEEREIAAKCIECGYLRKNENMLEPKIIVIAGESSAAFSALSNRLHDNMQEVKEKIADELAGFIKRHTPEHLIGDYPLYMELIIGGALTTYGIEECIKEGLLSQPENGLGAEGVLMIVEK